jgi:HAD superfamily hydrolase (TIGR01509 family)
MCAMPRAAIFDLDGVLLDTEPLYTRATQSIVGEFGKTYSLALKRRIMGGTAEQGAAIIVSELSLPISPSEYLSRRRLILERLFQTTQPIDGAEQLVCGLRRLGLRLGIATSSERSLYELKTRNHSWFSLFSVTVCGDDPRVVHPKPAPDIFLLAARELGTEASACIVFEDSPAGVLAASASGARVVARRDPAIPSEDLAAADRVVEHYAELDLPASLESRGP